MDFARQRYWGEPIPVVFTEDNKIHILADEDLPLVLPELEKIMLLQNRCITT